MPTPDPTTCARCGQPIWRNAATVTGQNVGNLGWSSSLPGSATTHCPDGMHLHHPAQGEA